MADDAKKAKPAERREVRARVLPAVQESRVLQTPGGEVVVVPSAEDGRSLTAILLMGGIALFEPELIGGMLIGAGIMYASKWLPDLIGDVVAPVVGGVVRPVAKTAVELGYATVSKTQELVSTAVEGVEDMIAEARAKSEGQE
jgi:hypothetical protein